MKNKRGKTEKYMTWVFNWDFLWLTNQIIVNLYVNFLAILSTSYIKHWVMSAFMFIGFLYKRCEHIGYFDDQLKLVVKLHLLNLI